MKKYLVLLLLLLVSYAQAVTLVWDPRPEDEGVTSYNVYKIQGSHDVFLVSVDAPATSVNVDQWLTGRRTFFVRAVNSFGEGPDSSKVTIHK